MNDFEAVAMRRVLLIQIDGKQPNLALMKIARHHRNTGDEVILVRGAVVSSRLYIPDRVYISCIFSENGGKAKAIAKQFPRSEVQMGGSGVSLSSQLSDDIEHLMPDYDLFNCNYSTGFTSRGCIRKCPFCIVPEKEGHIKAVADIYEFWDPRHKHLVIQDNNILALPEHFEKIADQIRSERLTVDFNQGLDFRLLTSENIKILKALRIKPTIRFSWDNPGDIEKVKTAIEMLRGGGINRAFWYVLVGYNSTIEEDISRLDFLKEHGQRAYVMRYKTGEKIYADMAAWANQPAFFVKKTFEEFREMRALA